jgi:hypothetical protein
MRLDAVLVRDVFSRLTVVPPVASSASPAWSIFTTSGSVPMEGSLLPPTAGGTIQYGDAIEDVRFVRDEMLNMIWAIEEMTEGAAGCPQRGYECSARRATMVCGRRA